MIKSVIVRRYQKWFHPENPITNESLEPFSPFFLRHPVYLYVIYTNITNIMSEALYYVGFIKMWLEKESIKQKLTFALNI